MIERYPAAVLRPLRGLGLAALLLPALCVATVATQLLWPYLKLMIVGLLLLVFLKLWVAYTAVKQPLPTTLLWAIGLCGVIAMFLDVVFLPVPLYALTTREFGTLTRGIIFNHQMQTGRTPTYYVSFQYRVADTAQPYAHQQEVDSALYHQLLDGAAVPVYYLPVLPTISVMQDDEHLKARSMLAIALSLWCLFIILILLGYDYVGRKFRARPHPP